MIVGLTHDEHGQVRIRRSVVTKVAIGLGPNKNSNHPSKLDHFVILKKGQEDGKVVWTPDTDKQEFFKKQNDGKEPTSLSIVLLDDNPDDVLRCEYAWWVKSGKKCSGDGEKAVREDKPWTPCANHGCKDLENGDCKPSADLYFMLADFPSLGTVCRLHTSSYQSIQELYSALTDLRSMMGGRLLGLPVKLFVRPERNAYDNHKGERVTGTKWVLGLEVSSTSMPKLLESVSESAKVFSEMRQLMRGRTLEIEEDDDERGAEISGEFHPVERLLPAAPLEDPLIAECKALLEAAGVNAAGQSMMLGQYQGKLSELKASLTKPKESPEPVGAAPTVPPPARGRGKGRKTLESTTAQVCASTPAVAVPPASTAPPAKKTGFSF